LHALTVVVREGKIPSVLGPLTPPQSTTCLGEDTALSPRLHVLSTIAALLVEALSSLTDDPLVETSEDTAQGTPDASLASF
jgi:hypothetical protein